MEITLIGDFAVKGATGKQAVPRSGRQVLAAVALEGAMPRALAAGLLWPDKCERRALANLRSALWRLRSAGIDALDESDTAVLRLRPEVSVDLDEALGRSWAAGDIDRLRRDVLDGWHESWLTWHQVRWRQVRLHALDRLCQVHLDNGESHQAAALATEVLVAEPARETTARLLAAAHLALDDPSAAKGLLSDFRSELARGQSLTPSSRFDAMEQRVAAHPSPHRPARASRN